MQRTLFSFPVSRSSNSSSSISSRTLTTISLFDSRQLKSTRKYSVSCSSTDNSNPSPEMEMNESGKPIPKKEMTALEKHVAFFDRNKDGLIYPWETTIGFVAIGFNPILAVLATIPANVILTFITRPWKFPDPLLPIEVKNISRATHGSTSGAYDKEGRFDNDKFEDIFKKHAHKDPECLTHEEMMDMLNANREPCDFMGWLSAYAEWQGLYVLCKNNHDNLEKETVRACFDGSLFEKIEKDRKHE